MTSQCDLVYFQIAVVTVFFNEGATAQRACWEVELLAFTSSQVKLNTYSSRNEVRFVNKALGMDEILFPCRYLVVMKEKDKVSKHMESIETTQHLNTF